MWKKIGILKKFVKWAFYDFLILLISSKIWMTPSSTVWNIFTNSRKNNEFSSKFVSVTKHFMYVNVEKNQTHLRNTHDGIFLNYILQFLQAHEKIEIHRLVLIAIAPGSLEPLERSWLSSILRRTQVFTILKMWNCSIKSKSRAQKMSWF